MSRILAALAVLLFSVPAAAQEEHAALRRDIVYADLPDTPEVEELVFGEEISLYDPSGQGLRPLHEALRRAAAGEGQARIMVYGASHVAADFFSNVVRERLQTRFGDAGHGFLMPARPWRGYRHLGGVSVESPRRGWEGLRVRASTRDVEPLGHAGMAVEGDSANSWGRIDTGERAVGRWVIFYLEQPEGGSFDVSVDGRRVARIATASDEVRGGFRAFTMPDAPHQLEVRLRGDGPVRIFGSSVEREAPGVIVDTMGLNGARAVSHLYWQEEMHRQYLRMLAPDLVILAYGTNESGDDGHPIEEYEAELRAVVARTRGTVPDAACMLIGPSDRPMREDGEYVDRPRTTEVNEVQRRVSRDMGCVYFDLVAFGGGPLSMLQWAHTNPPFAQRDYVHFTGRGYHRLGDVLHDTLLRAFQ